MEDMEATVDVVILYFDPSAWTGSQLHNIQPVNYAWNLIWGPQCVDLNNMPKSLTLEDDSQATEKAHLMPH